MAPNSSMVFCINIDIEKSLSSPVLAPAVRMTMTTGAMLILKKLETAPGLLVTPEITRNIIGFLFCATLDPRSRAATMAFIIFSKNLPRASRFLQHYSNGLSNGLTTLDPPSKKIENLVDPDKTG